METRKIGPLEVSAVGLGCNNFGRRTSAADAEPIVSKALDVGITLFDTAESYGGEMGRSEQILGAALGAHRDEVVIATKFGGLRADGSPADATPAEVHAACERSLRRLGRDHIDLYQLHRPDPEVPIDETLGALTELVEAGKVRAIGHSNMTAVGIEEADRAARAAGTAAFVTSQEQWSLLERDIEDEVVPAVERLGLRLLPFYPLAAGLLTGKYRSGGPVDPSWRLAARRNEPRFAGELAEERLAVVDALAGFAAAHEHTLLELAVSWLLDKAVVLSVIAGASRPEQVASNAAAATWRLTDEQRSEIDRITGRAPSR